MSKQRVFATTWKKIRSSLPVVLGAAPNAVRAVQDTIQKLKLERYGAKILVVGYTGTGKTALITNLLASEPVEILESTKQAEERAVKIPLTKKSKQYPQRIPDKYLRGPNVILVDTPGNVMFKSELEKQLGHLGSGQFLGIVNVVAAGYNDSAAFRLETDDPPAYLDNGEVNPDYLQSNREQDLKFLKDWFHGNQWLHDRVRWMITAVNKYDLWSPEKMRILDYYGREGVYGKSIGEIIGSANYFVEGVCAAEPTGKAGHFRARQFAAEDLVASKEELASQNSRFLALLGERVAKRFPKSLTR